MLNINNKEEIIIPIIFTFLKSSFLSKKGIKKNSMLIPLKAYMFERPLKKVGSIPFPNIGNKLDGLNIGIAKANIISMLINTIGTISTFVNVIVLNPALFKIMLQIKNEILKTSRGVLGKYIDFNISEKFLNVVALAIANNPIKRMPITIFKNLPPRASETSKISIFSKGLNNL